MRFIVGYDADTGLRISFFYRRKRPYFYLINRLGRFVRRIRQIEIRFVASIEYHKEKAKRGNPLYVDAIFSTAIWDYQMDKYEKIKDILNDRLHGYVRETFGDAIRLLEDRGYEYGSEIKVLKYPEGEYKVIWGHSLDEFETSPHSDEGYISVE